MKFVLAFVVLVSQALSQVFLLGDQDYADGALIGSSPAWLAAQSGEPLPFSVLHTDPTTISWGHTGIPVGATATLTFSLWDLDNLAAGNQVTQFLINGVAQAIGVFEVPVADGIVRVYSFPLSSLQLATGTVGLALTLGNSPANIVGIDFSRVEVNTLFQPNTVLASLSINGVPSAPSAPPYMVTIPSGGTFSMSWTGTPSQPILLVVGAALILNAPIAGLGVVNVGTGPQYQDVSVLVDPLSSPLGFLFYTNTAGTAQQSFTLSSAIIPPGTILCFQGAIGQALGTPIPVGAPGGPSTAYFYLTAAFQVTFN